MRSKRPQESAEIVEGQKVPEERIFSWINLYGLLDLFIGSLRFPLERGADQLCWLD